MATMAKPGTIQVHVEVDLLPARRLVKRALRDLEEANRELATQASAVERIHELEDQLAAEYGIRIERIKP